MEKEFKILEQLRSEHHNIKSTYTTKETEERNRFSDITQIN